VSRFDDLARLLRDSRGVDEWVATSRARTVGSIAHGEREGRRLDERVALGAIVHRDLPGGRGTARCAITGGSMAPVVAEAIARAADALGPTWRMAPPSAPAEVETADRALAEPRADDIAERIATAFFARARGDAAALAARAGGPVAIAALEIDVVWERIDVASSQGLHVQWDATEARARLVVTSGSRTARAALRSRRLAGLDPALALNLAADRLATADAAPPAPGAYPIVLGLGALAPDDGGHGVWAAFVAQADAGLVRQGLSRYRPEHGVIEDAAVDPEPLTITSDGTLAYGLESARLGDQAEPVRRFVLVERGVARELAYDQREAALAGARPNGGVRNVLVDPGASPRAALLAGGPLIEVDAWAWIELEPRTGELSAGIAHGTLHDGDRRTPIAGGVVQGDAIAALAHGRRSVETAVRGAYRGPVAIRLPPMVVS